MWQESTAEYTAHMVTNSAFSNYRRLVVFPYDYWSRLPRNIDFEYCFTLRLDLGVEVVRLDLRQPHRIPGHAKAHPHITDNNRNRDAHQS